MSRLTAPGQVLYVLTMGALGFFYGCHIYRPGNRLCVTLSVELPGQRA